MHDLEHESRQLWLNSSPQPPTSDHHHRHQTQQALRGLFATTTTSASTPTTSASPPPHPPVTMITISLQRHACKVFLPPTTIHRHTDVQAYGARYAPAVQVRSPHAVDVKGDCIGRGGCEAGHRNPEGGARKRATAHRGDLFQDLSDMSDSSFLA
jgi:hypothetical protein